MLKWCLVMVSTKIVNSVISAIIRNIKMREGDG